MLWTRPESARISKDLPDAVGPSIAVIPPLITYPETLLTSCLAGLTVEMLMSLNETAVVEVRCVIVRT